MGCGTTREIIQPPHPQQLKPLLTLSSCLYSFQINRNKDVYLRYIYRFLRSVGNTFYLVIYTDEVGSMYLEPFSLEPNIRIILLHEEWMYQYNNRDKWMSNSKKDIFSVNWKLNMINAEKMHFIYKTAYILYFPKTLWYGWCDIDYFNEVKDRDMKWCNHFKLLWLNHEKIYFSLMCREHLIMDILKKQIQTKDKTGVPVEPISKSIYIIPTNFFLLSRENVEWMKTIYNEKLNLYFKNNVSIYSDQTILLDIILSDINELNTRFVLLQQPHNFADDKYQFIRLLL